MKKLFYILSTILLLTITLNNISHVHASGTPIPLSSQDIATLVKPSIVFVHNEISQDDFEIDIPRVDLDKLTITPVKQAKKGSVPPLDVDKDLTKQLGIRSLSQNRGHVVGGDGSGMIINSDGYILTNAHVASPSTTQNELLESIVSELISEFDKSTKNKYAYDDLNDSEKYDFQHKVLEYLMNHTTVTASHSTLTVLNPSVSTKTMGDAVNAGFPATIVKVNETYPIDGKDFAIIKIDARDLPAVLLSSQITPPTTGDDVYLFGFPSSASISTTDFSDASFTKGVINAVKSDGPHHLPIYQTDAKLSPGSSGSPMIDSLGNVIGVVTYGSSRAEEGGDGFGYSIPINLAKDFLASAGIQNIAGSYYTNVLSGLQQSKENHCKSALASFDQASLSTSSIFVDSGLLYPYKTNCKNLIATGKSEDTSFQQVRGFIKQNIWFAIVIIAVIILLIINFIGDGFILKRLLSDEKKINELSSEIHPQKDQL